MILPRRSTLPGKGCRSQDEVGNDPSATARSVARPKLLASLTIIRGEEEHLSERERNGSSDTIDHFLPG